MKRRFSVSASMEEISQAGLAGSQPGLGPEQAALAQSQHFDQLEALWNKQSPPPRPRGLVRTLTKQSSLQATRISDSEEEGKRIQCYPLLSRLLKQMLYFFYDKTYKNKVKNSAILYCRYTGLNGRIFSIDNLRLIVEYI